LEKKTSRPISIKLDANCPCMRGVQVCSNKGPGPHQKGDNHKNAIIGWGCLKIKCPKKAQIYMKDS
jgi:hypothetical protein